MATKGSFGAFHKKRRIALGKTLRQFCLEHGLDPGNTSKLERGRLQPLQGEKLNDRAKILCLEKGTEDWHTFFDLAAAERGMIPQDIMDRPDAVKKLPLFFRRLRGQEVTEEDLEELIKIIRES
jgi:hypothetical protein